MTTLANIPRHPPIPVQPVSAEEQILPDAILHALILGGPERLRGELTESDTILAAQYLSEMCTQLLASRIAARALRPRRGNGHA